MNDANDPSLLSVSYIVYCNCDDPVYKETKNYIKRDESSLGIQGLISNDKEEKTIN